MVCNPRHAGAGGFSTGHVTLAFDATQPICALCVLARPSSRGRYLLSTVVLTVVEVLKSTAHAYVDNAT